MSPRSSAFYTLALVALVILLLALHRRAEFGDPDDERTPEEEEELQEEIRRRDRRESELEAERDAERERETSPAPPRDATARSAAGEAASTGEPELSGSPS